jgi:ABC-2 type transport system permease protein
MRNTWTIARRELTAYFVSPIAYAVSVVFMLVLGLIFNFFVLPYAQQIYATTEPLFSNLALISLFIAPALTMRLIAEERQSRTIELLMTAPVRDSEVIVGKFLAGLGFYLFLILLASVFPLILLAFGNPDPRVLLSGYIGIVLFGGALMALGTLASALTRNQIVAFILGFGMLLALWLIDVPASLFGEKVGRVMQALSITQHLGDFTQGIVDTRHIIYYLSVIFGALFLATRALEGRKWR